MSRAAAVLLYNYDTLHNFLSSHPHINNKLACLVRELQNLPHLKVIYSAFALLGVHVIEPFHARTISTQATHSSLKVFYKELYDSLSTSKIGPSFLALSEPFFPGISLKLFDDIKTSYGTSVLKTVTDTALGNEEDVVMLINHILPEMAVTLARQRRDYGID